MGSQKKKKKQGGSCQYLENHPVLSECKLISAGLVLLDGL